MKAALLLLLAAHLAAVAVAPAPCFVEECTSDDEGVCGANDLCRWGRQMDGTTGCGASPSVLCPDEQAAVDADAEARNLTMDSLVDPAAIVANPTTKNARTCQYTCMVGATCPTEMSAVAGNDASMVALDSLPMILPRPTSTRKMLRLGAAPRSAH